MRVHPLAGLEALERRLLVIDGELESAAGSVVTRARHAVAQVNGENGAANFTCGRCRRRILFSLTRSLGGRRRGGIRAARRRRRANNRVSPIDAFDSDFTRGKIGLDSLPNFYTVYQYRIG